MSLDELLLGMALGAAVAAFMEGSEGLVKHPADRGCAGIFVAAVCLIAAGLAWAALHLGVVR